MPELLVVVVVAPPLPVVTELPPAPVLVLPLPAEQAAETTAIVPAIPIKIKGLRDMFLSVRALGSKL
jgi:hypothetical protein